MNPSTLSPESPAASQPLFSSLARRHGKIARLPRALRHQINQALEEGLTYHEILQQLGPAGEDLSEQTLSRWKDGGYKDWLTERAFAERLRLRQDTAAELAQDFDATEVSHGALQLGTLQIFEALRDMGPGSLDEKLGGDCAAFARLLNALARASRETMQLQTYRQACAEARAALDPRRDPNRPLTDEERRAIVRKLDDVMGLRLAPEPGDFASEAARPKPQVGVRKPDPFEVVAEGAADGQFVTERIEP